MTHILNNHSNNFYRMFPVNHFLRKADYLKFLLDNIDKHEKLIYGGIKFYENNDDYKNTILIEMRMNYYHMVETLFTLIHALTLKGKSYKELEYKIFINLIKDYDTRNIYNKFIPYYDDILNDEYFDIKQMHTQIDTSIGEFIFYRGLKFDNDIKYLIPIEKLLNTFASDFVNSREYNGYKHGMFYYPLFSKLEIIINESGEKIYSDDLLNTFASYDLLDSNKVLVATIQKIEPQKEYVKTLCGTLLIWNIIKLRDAIINKKEECNYYLIDDSIINNNNMTMNDVLLRKEIVFKEPLK